VLALDKVLKKTLRSCLQTAICQYDVCQATSAHYTVAHSPLQDCAEFPGLLLLLIFSLSFIYVCTSIEHFKYNFNLLRLGGCVQN